MKRSQEQIYQIVASLLAKVSENSLTVSSSEIRGKSLTIDLNLDSLDVINLVFLVEERFAIKMAEDDLDSLGLMEVDNLVKYLYEKG